MIIQQKINKGCTVLSQRIEFKVLKKELTEEIFATPRIVDSGESIFDYEYLRQFEAKIEKVLAFV